jgi:RNA polymerase sigma-70 factor (ECF subfamily)
VKTWLLSIVHHRAIDEVWRRRRLATFPEDDEDPPTSLTLPDVWDEVANRFDASAVREAFAQLPQAQRETLLMAYYQGLSSDAIAARTNVPLGTVKGRIRLGLGHLRRALIEDAAERSVHGSSNAGRSRVGSKPAEGQP